MNKKIPEITLKYSPKITEKITVISSRDAYNLFLPFFPADSIQLIEQFAVMYLNRANKILGIWVASTGGLTGTVADPKLILAVALKSAAPLILLAHNRPSGNLKPSESDNALTERIKDGCKILNINLVDHLIITAGDAYFSFVDEGML